MACRVTFVLILAVIVAITRPLGARLPCLGTVLDVLEHENDVDSPKDPWASPSPWLNWWMQLASEYVTTEDQKKLMAELAVQNNVVSKTDKWASPSPWLWGWISRMRAAK